MALPTAVPSFWTNRSRVLEHQIVRHREQEARFRQQWELNSRYFRQSGVYSAKQAQWGSRQSYQQSMNAYHREKQKEEDVVSLEERRLRLQRLLFKEREMLAEELHELRLAADEVGAMRRKNEELKSAREEHRKQVAEDRLYERWKNNSAKLREVESKLRQKHVAEAWGDQKRQKEQRDVAEHEEKVRTENKYETARREALERMKEEEERRKEKERKRADFLRQQMEELRQREEEAAKLKNEEEELMKERWELDVMEAERKRQEEERKKGELRRFLKHQYQAQMKRRAQEVQEELEKDRQILLALSEKEEEDRRLRSVRREEARAAAAWMKEVIEDQLRLEREREAELDSIFREEARELWEKREAEWEKERKARDRLMAEVLAERARQILRKMEANRQAQEELVESRERLIQQLEEAKRTARCEKEAADARKSAQRQELEAQLTERRAQEEEERQQRCEEEAEARREEEREREMERLEAQHMAERGYHDKFFSYPKTAWT